MYSKIINPLTGRKILVKSRLGGKNLKLLLVGGVSLYIIKDFSNKHLIYLILVTILVGLYLKTSILQYILFYLSRTFHEKLTHDIMSNIINQANIKSMIDAGGWLGDTCTQLAENNPELVIYTIEPSLENCNFIKKYIKNHKIKNIKVIQKCLSSNSKYKFKTKLNDIYSDKTYEISNDGISATTIDSIYKKQPDLGLIHLDVEGHEFECLKGGIKSIKKGNIIFVVEILERNIYKQDIINLFRNNNYMIYIIPENVGVSWRGLARNCIFFPKNYTKININNFVRKYGLKKFKTF